MSNIKKYQVHKFCNIFWKKIVFFRLLNSLCTKYISSLFYFLSYGICIIIWKLTKCFKFLLPSIRFYGKLAFCSLLTILNVTDIFNKHKHFSDSFLVCFKSFLKGNHRFSQKYEKLQLLAYAFYCLLAVIVVYFRNRKI